MRILITASVLLVFSITALAAKPGEPPEPEPLRWTINGEEREAIVIVPEAKHKRPLPVVFVFHGHGSTMQAFVRRWNVGQHWPEAIGVYMQGVPTPSKVDPKGKKAGWQSTVGTQKNRDLKFVDAVLKTLHEKHAIDHNRIYATGHSNGGGFTYVLWVARPKVFAAYAPCSVILRYPEDAALEPNPVLHIAGEQDMTAPIENQLESMAKVRQVNLCREEPVDWGPGCKLYPPKSAAGAPFVSFIHPGGHGPPPGGFETIIKFFQEHPRQRSNPAAGE